MKKSILLTVICVCAAMLVISLSCKKTPIQYTTTSDVNIVDYLRRYPDQFSEFVKMLDRANISPFLNAYGAYTCFAPNNAGIAAYLKKIGKTSSDQLDTAAIRAICRLHLIEDTITTLSFTDGKMNTPTMYGQYLITSVNGEGSTVVNRQAIIVQPNIHTGNGYIHVLDNVLQPASLTVAQSVEQNSRYTIFTQALKATGFYDSLNINNNPDSTRTWLTVLAEPDSVYNAIGINSYSDLVHKYNNTGNPKNPNDSLFLYMAYHVLPGLNYVADIASAQSHTTLAPLNVVTALLSGTTVLLNQATFNGVFEPGVAVDRVNSDVSCTNGVLDALTGDIYLKLRTPVPVYWDVADQPEIRKLTSVFRKAGKSNVFTYGSLSGVTWQNTTISAVTYNCDAATGTNYYYWNDHLDFNLRTPSNQNQWIEFTTPLLVKGTYKVWICYRRTAAQGTYTQVTFDGVPTSRLVDLTQYLPSTTATDAVLESQGFKRYSSSAALTVTTQVGQLAGVINVATTDVHKIRLTAIKDAGSSGNSVTLDMIHFIPIDQNQLRPLFGKDGTITP